MMARVEVMSVPAKNTTMPYVPESVLIPLMTTTGFSVGTFHFEDTKKLRPLTTKEG